MKVKTVSAKRHNNKIEVILIFSYNPQKPLLLLKLQCLLLCEKTMQLGLAVPPPQPRKVRSEPLHTKFYVLGRKVSEI